MEFQVLQVICLSVSSRAYHSEMTKVQQRIQELQRGRRGRVAYVAIIRPPSHRLVLLTSQLASDKPYSLRISNKTHAGLDSRTS